jgi:hypothetical protein
MAGGWEEVAPAGSWIGTGAGTGEELNKHEGVGGAAESEYGVGEAAAVRANCIWLMSGATVALNFLRKSMPRMGPATVACKKLGVKSLPWNCTVFLMKPQEGMVCPSAPLSRGPDGLEFWLQGTMLKVAPVSTKYLSFVSSSVRKISPALAGGGRGGAIFGAGVTAPFVASPHIVGSRAPTSLSRGDRDHRIVATWSIPQGIRGLHHGHGCRVVASSYCFTHGRGKANKKHGQEKIIVPGETPGGRCCFSFPMRTLGLRPCISTGRRRSSK